MEVTVHTSMASIDRREWNRLKGADLPFSRYEFLHAAESSGCVSDATGWRPTHLTISSKNGLRAAMPLYEKHHSWGEFVFDWSWANAYGQAGLNYYPKLVSAAPFTPASGRRLLLAEPQDTEAANALLQAAIQLARENQYSSLHVLFPASDELVVLESNGLLVRKDCQFHWHNKDYVSFDAFLAGFSSSKRKKAKRDRRKVQEAGIQFRHLQGAEMSDEDWSTVYALISRTFLIRGNTPYFSEAFFRTIGEHVPKDILAIVAEIDGRAIAASVFLQSADTLYGRYWGCNGHYDALHFETCYYQGIEYCIDTGRSFFEPGTQGEHKISRGFSPVETWSAHWLSHAQFANVIGNYLHDEAEHIDRYIDAVESHTPYKTPDDKSS